MSTYAIGDVQGCCDELVLLLDRINFDARRDRLWFTGDLVNRGPKSAATLRLIRSFGGAALTVLGNHDLFMLGVARGAGQAHKGDTFADVLGAPDAASLLDWLLHQPLAHSETIDGSPWLMVHAGVLPGWDSAQTMSLAHELEHAVRNDPHYFSHMRGNTPAAWSEALTGYERLRVIVNALTRLRFCTAEGVMDFSTKTDIAPTGHLAWYEVPARRTSGTSGTGGTSGTNLVYGHWAARGLRLEAHLAGIDTGCVWGRQLTALRLEDRTLFAVECVAGARGYGGE